jgi:hypothetical protein
MIKFLTSFFTGRSGKPSAMRLNITIWNAGILFCIIWSVIKTNQFPNIPEVLALTIPANLVAKAYQNKNETPAGPVG